MFTISETGCIDRKEGKMKKEFWMTVVLFMIAAALVAASAPTLEEGLAWVMSGGGAGVITYILIDKVPFLKKLAPDYKRYASIGIVVALAWLGWGATMLMKFSPMPETWRAWIESGFSISFVAITTSQLTHGVRDLRQKRLANE